MPEEVARINVRLPADGRCTQLLLYNMSGPPIKQLIALNPSSFVFPSNISMIIADTHTHGVAVSSRDIRNVLSRRRPTGADKNTRGSRKSQ